MKDKQYWMITVGGNHGSYYSNRTVFIDCHPVDWLLDQVRGSLGIPTPIVYSIPITKEQYLKANKSRWL